MNSNTATRTPATADKSTPDIPNVPQDEFEALSRFGEQVSALIGGHQTDKVQWKRAAQEVGVFAAKAGVVTMCAVGVMTIAKHMSKDVVTTD